MKQISVKRGRSVAVLFSYLFLFFGRGRGVSHNDLLQTQFTFFTDKRLENYGAIDITMVDLSSKKKNFFKYLEIVY